MVPLASLAALICVGIEVDFSGQTIAEQDLRDQASRCARQGAASATMGARSTALAVDTAYQCLSASGLRGTVSLNGTSLVVDLTATYQTKVLTIVAINRLPVRGTASVTINQGR